MKSVLIGLTLTLLASSAFAAQEEPVCPTNQALRSAGWMIHGPTEFGQHARAVTEMLAREKADFVKETEGVVYSSVASRMVRVVSYDRLSTPQSLMYGDIVLISDATTEALLEVRWFDGHTRHVAVNGAKQACASNMIPMADNSLF